MSAFSRAQSLFKQLEEQEKLQQQQQQQPSLARSRPGSAAAAASSSSSSSSSPSKGGDNNAGAVLGRGASVSMSRPVSRAPSIASETKRTAFASWVQFEGMQSQEPPLEKQAAGVEVPTNVLSAARTATPPTLLQTLADPFADDEELWSEESSDGELLSPLRKNPRKVGVSGSGGDLHDPKFALDMGQPVATTSSTSMHRLDSIGENLETQQRSTSNRSLHDNVPSHLIQSSSTVPSTVLSRTTTLTSTESDKPALPPRPAAQQLVAAQQLLSPPSVPPRSSTSSNDEKPPLPARPKLRIGMSELSIATEATGISRSTYTRLSDKSAIYPDSTDANRRPPRSSLYPKTMQAKPTIRSIAASKEFVCIGGHSVKIFNAATGETIPISAQKQEVRVTALAFVPCLTLEQDGQFLWAGFSDGDLWMIDCLTGTVLERRISAHSHPIHHILRFRRQLWSLDENGVLQIWSEIHPQALENEAYRSDIISLEGRPRTFRIAPKQSAAVVVGTLLWTAREKVIEVFSPVEEGSNAHKKRIEVPGNYSVITCMTVCDSPVAEKYLPTSPSQFPFSMHDPFRYRVYTGHMDGKIIEWDTMEYAKKRVFDLGSYRIASMVAATSRQLWAGIGTGKVMVMDVGTSNANEPVAVLKEWQAEVNDPIEYLHLDPDSLVHTGQLLVTSCSKAGSVQIWNANLEDDFVDMELKRREKEYCSSQDISVFIGSWNIDASKPEHLEFRPDDKYLFDKMLALASDGPDIAVFGLQEIVDLESKKLAARGLFKNATTSKKQESQAALQNDYVSRAALWKDRLLKAMRDNFKSNYQLVDSRNLVGLFTCIFIKDEHFKNNLVSNFLSYTVSTGLGGAYGNKGAIISRLVFNDSSFCFMTVHLPAHQDKIGKRNVDATTILRSPGMVAVSEADLNRDLFVRGGDGSQVLDHEYCFFFGDLNYRIDLPREHVVALIEREDWPALWAADQLIKQRSLSNTTCLLRIFEESPLAFAPTYKYDPGTDIYDTSEKRRTPAWCDRILYRDGSSRCLASAVDPSKRLVLSSPSPDSPSYSRQVSHLLDVPDGHRQTVGPLASQNIRQESYRRFECKVSDHRPIASKFVVATKKVDPHRKLTVLKAIEMDWKAHLDRLLTEASMEWLMLRVDAKLQDAPTFREEVQECYRKANGSLTAALRELLSQQS